MSLANPSWGAPRIHGELLKLGIELSPATVAKYMVRNRRPPSQTWRTFLKNHMQDLASADFFVVPTATFRLLFVFVILSHHRRRVVHFAVTTNPTAEWVAHQLLDAFPWDSTPRYLLRDRDGSYGGKFSEAAEWLGVQEVLTAPQSPWQNAYVERLIGSIRRECLDHVIILHESGLRRMLRSYFEYYERSRTHLGLGKDAPIPRAVEPPELGRVIELPQVGGLHHRYQRRAAWTNIALLIHLFGPPCVLWCRQNQLICHQAADEIPKLKIPTLRCPPFSFSSELNYWYAQVYYGAVFEIKKEIPA
jgi:putative transposase